MSACNLAAVINSEESTSLLSPQLTCGVVNVQVTDAGAELLHKLKDLQHLHLFGSSVSAAISNKLCGNQMLVIECKDLWWMQGTDNADSPFA